MKTIARAVESPQAVGEHLPLPWQRLESKVNVATKQLLIIAGAPGGGKTTLALNWVMNVDDSVLYLAQDDASSVLARLVALAADIETDDAFDAMGDEGTRLEMAERVREARPNLVLESGALAVEEIAVRIDALHEWLGESPRLVIVDNLIDMKVPGYQPGEMGFYMKVLPELKQLAVEKDVCMVALHHTVRKTADGQSVGGGGVPLKMTDLNFAGERDAGHVWGVYNDQKARLTVQILKQRDGRADRDGGLRVNLTWIPEMCVIRSR